MNNKYCYTNVVEVMSMSGHLKIFIVCSVDTQFKITVHNMLDIVSWK